MNGRRVIPERFAAFLALGLDFFFFIPSSPSPSSVLRARLLLLEDSCALLSDRPVPEEDDEEDPSVVPDAESEIQIKEDPSNLSSSLSLSLSESPVKILEGFLR
jgi:hypothetical protein